MSHIQRVHYPTQQSHAHGSGNVMVEGCSVLLTPQPYGASAWRRKWNPELQKCHQLWIGVSKLNLRQISSNFSVTCTKLKRARNCGLTRSLFRMARHLRLATSAGVQNGAHLEHLHLTTAPADVAQQYCHVITLIRVTWMCVCVTKQTQNWAIPMSNTSFGQITPHTSAHSQHCKILNVVPTSKRCKMIIFGN